MFPTIVKRKVESTRDVIAITLDAVTARVLLRQLDKMQAGKAYARLLTLHDGLYRELSQSPALLAGETGGQEAERDATLDEVERLRTAMEAIAERRFLVDDDADERDQMVAAAIAALAPPPDGETRREAE